MLPEITGGLTRHDEHLESDQCIETRRKFNNGGLLVPVGKSPVTQKSGVVADTVGVKPVSRRHLPVRRENTANFEKNGSQQQGVQPSKNADERGFWPIPTQLTGSILPRAGNVLEFGSGSITDRALIVSGRLYCPPVLRPGDPMVDAALRGSRAMPKQRLPGDLGRATQ